MTNSKLKYNFSFTAAAFRLSDFLKFAEYFKDFTGEIITTEIDAAGILGSGNQKSDKRIAAELVKRFNSLTDAQKELLHSGSFDEKRQVCYLAITKTYSFIRDFVIEIVREKVLALDFQIEDSDFNIFINRKQVEHPELEKLTEKTIYKIKQTLFKILADAGILDSTSSKQIQPQWVFDNLKRVIVHDNPAWLKIFLLNDSEIENSRL